MIYARVVDMQGTEQRVTTEQKMVVVKERHDIKLAFLEEEEGVERKDNTDNRIYEWGY